jgi:hypothetical protein
VIHKGPVLGLVADVSRLFLHMIQPLLLGILLVSVDPSTYLRLERLPGVKPCLPPAT